MPRSFSPAQATRKQAPPRGSWGVSQGSCTNATTAHARCGHAAARALALATALAPHPRSARHASYGRHVRSCHVNIIAAPPTHPTQHPGIFPAGFGGLLKSACLEANPTPHGPLSPSAASRGHSVVFGGRSGRFLGFVCASGFGILGAVPNASAALPLRSASQRAVNGANQKHTAATRFGCG